VLAAQWVAADPSHDPLVTFLRWCASEMSERDAFGPNLRRIRVQRGISLEQLAASTKVSVALWKGLERNDFSRWPGGIYARSYVRDYAAAIGVDPESTVDDFCRWFPQGDRRAEREIRGQAQIVGHNNLEWRDSVPPVVAADGDRRGAAAAVASNKQPATTGSTLTQMFVRLRRAVGRA
jgi:transcriptional regulator with XRE-family HTH domain